MGGKAADELAAAVCDGLVDQLPRLMEQAVKYGVSWEEMNSAITDFECTIEDQRAMRASESALAPLEAVLKQMKEILPDPRLGTKRALTPASPTSPGHSTSPSRSPTKSPRPP